MKNARKHLKIYFRFTKKKIKRIAKIKLSPISISDRDIEGAYEGLEKVFKIIQSCKYIEHIDVAERYVEQYKKVFPFAIIVGEILDKKIINSRMKKESIHL